MALVLYILIVMQHIISSIYYVSDTVLGPREILFLNVLIELIFSDSDPIKCQILPGHLGPTEKQKLG